MIWKKADSTTHLYVITVNKEDDENNYIVINEKYNGEKDEEGNKKFTPVMFNLNTNDLDSEYPILFDIADSWKSYFMPSDRFKTKILSRGWYEFESEIEGQIRIWSINHNENVIYNGTYNLNSPIELKSFFKRNHTNWNPGGKLYQYYTDKSANLDSDFIGLI